jgi:hypothetical protein
VQWTYLQRFGRLDRLEEKWYGFGAPGPDNRQGFLNWLQSTRCDTLVYIDSIEGPTDYEDDPLTDLHAELRDLVMGQQVFHLVKAVDLPMHSCRVLVYRRNSP